MGTIRSLKTGAGAVMPFVNAIRRVDASTGEELSLTVLDGDPDATARLREILGVGSDHNLDGFAGPIVAVAIPGHDPSLAASVLARFKRQGRTVLGFVCAADVRERMDLERALLAHPPLEISNVAHTVSLDDADGVRDAVATILGDDAVAIARTTPGMRDAVARSLIAQSSRQAGAVGAAALVPGADLPILALLQVRLVAQLASAHGRPLDVRRGLEVVGVLAGAFGWRAVARRIASAVPVAGFAMRAGIAYSGTRAAGEAAHAYFTKAGDRADAPLDGLAGAISGALKKRKDTK